MEILALLAILLLIVTPILAISAFVIAKGNTRRIDEISESQKDAVCRIAVLERTTRDAANASKQPSHASTGQATAPLPERSRDLRPSTSPSSAPDTAQPAPVATTPRPVATPPPLNVPPTPDPSATKANEPPPFVPIPVQPSVATAAKAKSMPAATPPQSSVSAEVRWGAWLATRLGLVLAVIAAVFFGVYAAQHTPAWVRFTGLAGVALGITVLGHFLERKLRNYGQILFAGGLGLSFFTVWAGYALAPLKVISSVAVAVPALFIVVGVIIVCSLWKRREEIASMAVLLGALACWFSWWKDLDAFALAGALVLLIGGCGLYAAKLWRWPLILSLAGSSLIYLTHVFIEGQATEWVVYGYPSCLFALVLIADRIAVLRKHEPHLWRRVLIGVNSSLAIGTTLLAGWTYYPEAIATYYLVAGLVLIAISAAMHAARDSAFPTLNHFLKGMTLLALYLVSEYQDAARWLSLLGQAGVMLAVLRTHKNRWVEAGFFALVLASMLTFFIAQFSMSHRMVLGASEALLIVGTLIGYVLLLFAHQRTTREMYSKNGYANLSAISGLVVGYCMFFVISTWVLSEDMSLVLALFAFGLLIAAKLLRTLHPVWAAGLLLVFAHGFLFQYGMRLDGLCLGLSVGLIILLDLGIVAALNRYTQMRSPWLKLLDLAFFAGVVLVSLHAVRLTLPTQWWLLCGAGLSWLLLGLRAVRFRSWSLPDGIFFPAVVAMLGTIVFGGELTAAAWQSWAALGGVFALCWVMDARLVRTFRTQWFSSVQGGAWPLFIVTVMYAYYVPMQLLTAPWAMLTISLIGLTMTAGGNYRKLQAAVISGVTLIAMADALLLQDMLTHLNAGSKSTLGVAAVLALVTLSAMALVRKQLSGQPTEAVHFLHGIAGAAALVMPAVAVWQPGVGLTGYITPLWGVLALALFILGIVKRVAAYRLVGLAGLTVCIGRVFIYDITETLYRIIAFGVLAGVLLLVGFLYSRLNKPTQE